MVCRSKKLKESTSYGVVLQLRKISIRAKEKKNQFYARKSYKKCTQKTFKFFHSSHYTYITHQHFCGRKIKGKDGGAYNAMHI